MVWIINQRTAGYAGDIAVAACWETAGGAAPQYTAVAPKTVADRTAGKRVVVAVHGFNVNRPDAARLYVTLEQELRLDPSTHAFVGVCWPGDGVVPVVNYSWESKDANRCGALLAAYLAAAMPDAAAFDFVSHSLGARLLLGAVKALPDRVGRLCITAGAVDDDALIKEFAGLEGKAERISLLTSTRDLVLLGAYPLGDFVADEFLGDTDSPWHGALGFFGPKPRNRPPGLIHRPIPFADGYDHGDYFPPGGLPPPARQLWRRSVGYMERALKDVTPNPW